MPDVLVIEFQANTEKLKEVATALDQVTGADKALAAEYNKNAAAMSGSTEELRKKLQQLQKDEAALIALQKQSNQPAIIKQLDDQLIKVRADMAAVNKEAINLNGSVGKLSTGIKNIGATVQLAAAKKQFEETGKAINEAANKGVRLTTQLRDLKNQMSLLEQQGKQNTKQFTDLAIKTGKLQDQIDDTSRRVRILASDSRGIDFLTASVTGLAGGFSLVQGATALLGNENEDLQKSLLKVQASMAILNGLQAVNTALKKDDVIRTELQVAAHKAYAFVVGASTGAMKLFRIALLATGVGALIVAIGALIANFDKIKAKVLDLFPGIKEMGGAWDEVKQKVMGFLAAAFEAVTKVAKILFDFNTFQFKKGLAEIKTFGKDIAEAYKEGVREELENQEDKAIQDALVKTIADRNNEILIAEAKSGKERTDLRVQQTKDELALLELRKDEAIFQGKKGEQEYNDQVAAIEAKGIDLRRKAGEKANEQELKSIKALTEAKILLAKKGSEEELAAKLDLLEAEKNIASSDVNLTSNERFAIETKYQKDVLLLQQEFSRKKLADQLDVIDTALNAISISTEKEFQLKAEALQLAKQLQLSNVDITETERLKILSEFNQKEVDLIREFNATTLEIKQFGIEASLQAAVDGSNEEFELKKQLLAVEKEIEINKAEASIQNEELFIAALLEIDERYFDEYKKLLNEKAEADFNQRQQLAQAELDLANTLLDGQKSTNKNFLLEKLQNNADYYQSLLEQGEQFYKEQLDQGIIAQEEFDLKILELKKKAADAENALNDEQVLTDKELKKAIFDTSVQFANQLFEFSAAINDRELANLQDKFDKGLISQKQYDKAVAEIKRKQVVADKAQAAFNIIINTGVAISKVAAQTGILATILVAVIAALGAAQLATVLAQPIPKFAKGTEAVKGGQAGKDSVMAMLMPGERIVPTDVNKQLSGIPNKELPKLARLKTLMDEMPELNFEVLEKIKENAGGRFNFDYQLMANEFGKELKKHPQHFWTIDRHGIGHSVKEDGNYRKYLDDRYTA